ncbi:hypothetical protein [Natronorarus salvus]|uniref:hypothetical protein n=1 Tax=Natronorarus salvus TaxID=3117733 RepID=UPI002F266071
MTNAEIATALGVRERTVDKYLSSPPSQEAKAKMADVEAGVRYVAIAELKEQLRSAGHASKTAECPVKVWADDDGNLNVKDEYDDETGEVVDKYVVPDTIEIGPDEKARYFRREEAREIIDLLTDIVGAKAAERHKHEHSGEGGGPIEVVINDSIVTSDDS